MSLTLQVGGGGVFHLTQGQTLAPGPHPHPALHAYASSQPLGMHVHVPDLGHSQEVIFVTWGKMPSMAFAHSSP